MPDNNDEIRNQLLQIAGVAPSMNWIQSYYQAVPQQAHSNNNESADTLLRQILYQDLRDVVRELQQPASTGSSTTTAATDISAAPAPQQWRQVVRSQQPGSNNNLREATLKGTLPESFRLMIQVEEVVDVAQNAETRLGGNGGGNHQMQNRCLKLCISDGYYGNGTVFPDVVADAGSSSGEAMLAMEVSPIPNLAMNSKAGLKILLHGPIDIRWGVMLLHEGNALVLGGHVDQLVEIQAKALADAKRTAGVGVDPTVRALIWNPDTGEEQDEDEGEQGSADLAARQPAPMEPQAPSIPAFNPAVVPNQRQRPNNSNPPQGNTLRHPQQIATGQRQPPAIGPSPPINNTTQHIAESSGRNTLIGHNNSTPNLLLASRPQPRERANQQTNPYARVSGSSQISSVSSRSAFAAMPPPFDHRNSQRTESTTRTPTVSVPVVDEQPMPNVAIVNVSAASSSSSSRPQQMPPNIADLQTASSSSSGVPASSPVSACPPGTEICQNVSFVDLRELLVRASLDETHYKLLYGKVFLVPMKQCQPHHYFNIEKVKKKGRKKEDKKSEKKYELALHAKFQGSSSSEGLISCAISGDILEPILGHTAGELRHLARSDREKSQAHVNEGGKRVKEMFYKLGLLEVTLLHSADEFFQSTSSDTCPAVDGKRPILMIQCRHSCC